MPTATRATSRDKVRAHRARMRRKGMRLIQFWVPDVRTKAFKRRAHQEALAVAKSVAERDEQAFVDSISIWPDRPQVKN